MLDWEICTLGDPLADVGLLMVYWTDPDDEVTTRVGGRDHARRVPRRAELLARYAEISGRDLSDIDYYVAFGYWKLACIIEGVYARYVGGAMGDRGDAGAFDFFADQVATLVDAAGSAIGRLESSLYEYHQTPDLESPVLVVVLDGWIDAGLGAGAALESIVSSRPAELVATFDADALLDHRARRPTMHLVDGIQTGLSWPGIELRATADTDDNDVLILMGAEPDHAWRAFSDAVVTLAMALGARMIVGLGAYPAPVPHTRPTRVVSTTGSRELADRAGFVQGRVDVPAGVQAAIEEHAHSLGVPSLGLWAQVPHYASAMPYPAAGAALLDALALVAAVRFDSSGLRDDAQAARSRLDELIADSDEHQELVRQLEQQADSMSGPMGKPEGQPLPSGEELAAELERFLRDQDNP